MQNEAIQEVNWDKLNQISKLKDHQEFLYKLLTSKDSFIRKRIIDQNLAFLNQRLAQYLQRIGLPHTVKFLNDLTVEIQELGRDLDFDNLSRGERNRLILSLSWSFRDVWESLYTPVNLLFVDELIHEEVVIVPMYERGVSFVVDARLKGFKRRSVGPQVDYNYAYISDQ